MTDVSLFEEFEWYPEIQCWGGYFALGDRLIPLSVYTGGAEDQLGLDFARRVVRNLRTDEQCFRVAASQSLLNDYNLEWHRYVGEGPPITADEFVSRLSLTAVKIEYATVDARGKREWLAELTYNAARMFTEHAVAVYLDWNLDVCGVVLD